MIPVQLVQPRAVVLHRSVQRPDPEVQQDGEHEDDARVAQREEVADAQRTVAVLDQLAGGVIDSRDVVRVEGVPHPERVGEDARPESEDLRFRNVVVTVQCEQQHPPAEHVEGDDRESHAADLQPLARRQAVAKPLDPAAGPRHVVETPHLVSSNLCVTATVRQMRMDCKKSPGAYSGSAWEPPSAQMPHRITSTRSTTSSHWSGPAVDG